jgi:hypothetical protein
VAALHRRSSFRFFVFNHARVRFSWALNRVAGAKERRFGLDALRIRFRARQVLRYFHRDDKDFIDLLAQFFRAVIV